MSTTTPSNTRLRRARVVLAALATIAALAGPILPAGPAAAEAPGGPSLDIPTRRPYAHEHLSPSLRDDLAAAQAQPASPSSRRAAVEPVTVVLQSSDLAASRAAVVAAGGTVTDAAGDLLQAEVPPSELGELSESRGTTHLREPYPARVQTTSEGVNESGATPWIGGGDGGGGTKVAIVDVGFTGYLTKLGTELPLTVESDFSRCTGVGASDHGTAVAEIVHDEAPAAALLLVCVETDVEFASALATLAGLGVDVVNGSIGFTLTGRGDGSGGPGSPSAAVAALRQQGILYVAAAGNYGLTHWSFNATGDQDPNLPDDEDVVDIDADGALSFVVAPGATAFVSVSWDLWPTSSTDFDAYAGNDACGLVDSSENDQGNGAPPVELLTVVNCTGAFEVFDVLINRFSGSATPRMDLFFDGPVAQIEHVSPGGLPDPASAPAAFTVGAHCWASGVVDDYSSRGPTIDGRTKPDITGPDSTSSSVYGASTVNSCDGGFAGTSAAAPHVAGAAADLLSANPALDIAEVQQLLEDRALESGSTGKDNAYGSGRLRLGAAGSAPAPTPRRLTPMTPVRLFDSRPGTLGAAEAAFGGQGRIAPVGPNSEVAVQVAGIAGVPADATAVVLNVTVTEPTASGWITVHPDGAVPNASNLNFVPGRTVAVHVTATVGADDKVRFYNSHGNSHVVVDVAGWYGPTGAGNAGFTALFEPARAFDSRAGDLGFAEAAFGQAGRTQPLGAGVEVQVQLAGLGGIPSNATAVIANLTATAPSAQGWLTLYPTGAARPSTSSLNYLPGQTIANLGVLPLGTDGKVTVFNSHGSTHVVLDVIGYFVPGSGAGYVALDPPTRNLDSRTGNGPRSGAVGPGLGNTLLLQVGHYYGVPGRAAAVLLSVTAVSPTQAGWLTVWPTGHGSPYVSNLNFTAGAVVPNAVVTGMGSDGGVAIANSHGATHVVGDLAGYFVNP